MECYFGHRYECECECWQGNREIFTWFHTSSNYLLSGITLPEDYFLSSSVCKATCSRLIMSSWLKTLCVVLGAGECSGDGEPRASGAAVWPQGAGGDSGKIGKP